MTQAKNPFRYFDNSPEGIGLIAMMSPTFCRFALRQLGDKLRLD